MITEIEILKELYSRLGYDHKIQGAALVVVIEVLSMPIEKKQYMYNYLLENIEIVKVFDYALLLQVLYVASLVVFFVQSLTVFLKIKNKMNDTSIEQFLGSYMRWYIISFMTLATLVYYCDVNYIQYDKQLYTVGGIMLCIVSVFFIKYMSLFRNHILSKENS